MTLELAPTRHNMTYDEAILYCFLCTHNGHKDWRLATASEYQTTYDLYGWYQDDPESKDNNKFAVTPVRTKHDF